MFLHLFILPSKLNFLKETIVFSEKVSLLFLFSISSDIASDIACISFGGIRMPFIPLSIISSGPVSMSKLMQGIL